MPELYVIIDTVASHMCSCVAEDQLFRNTHIRMAHDLVCLGSH